jgi:8-amino-7-oxononanoate synthase
LERDLAEFKEAAGAAVFPSGYHVNLGLLPALADPQGEIILDRLAHASLVDGARLSRARLKVFAHNDPEDLRRVLGRRRSPGRAWVVTESVFSMDGDLAPLGDIVSVVRTAGAGLYVDEAHATGLWGPEGRGLVHALGLAGRVEVVMGTLSKALGGQGGFVTGSSDLIGWVHNRCRSFIYSTALAPASAAAAREALRIAREESGRRENVFSLARRLREGLGVAGEGPIVPWVVGEDGAALALARSLWEKGIFAPAVRPPTVPRGTARLRFSLTANHTEEDVDRLLSALRAR